MPKAPKSSGKSAARSGARKARSASGTGNGKAAATKPARRKAAGKPKAKPKAKQDGKVRTQPFEHQPVDEAPDHAPAGPKTKLTENQRELLGDLFAVVEEHSGDAGEEVRRRLVQE